jgi:signal transduction histidine kinase
LLEGFDRGWIRMGKERSIHYARVPPGEYTFKILASDQNGEWSSNYASIPLFVVPRWWQTVLARVLFLVLFTAVVGFIVRMILIRRMRMTIERARQETLLERERTRISKDLHDDLGARLTEIAFMADLAPGISSNPSAGKNAWSSIAERARKAVVSLDEAVWMIDPGNDVLEQFVPYVVQYTTEFCERSDLACRLDIPDSLPSIKLEGKIRHNLFLAFKEALNNVARHAHASLVKIAIFCESNRLKVSVSDNGKGLNVEEAESGQRHGIGNMRDRMARIGGEFDIRSDPETGTVVTFTLTFDKK